MKEELCIKRYGGSLFVRIPRWFVDIKDLEIGDTVIWKLEDRVDDDIKLQFVKALKQAAAE
jgi:antitoxin component of MazEF toxin-antitoxin module